MQERIRDIIQVSLMLVLCLSGILFTYHYTHVPEVEYVPTDTIEEPAFLSLSPEEGLMEALIYHEVEYPEIVYAQAILETGHFKSKQCIEGNNLFGLYNSKTNKYHSFNHWEESVIAYKNWIQYRWANQEDYYYFLQRIGYAEDPQYINKLKRVVKYESEQSKRRSITADTTVTR